MLNPFKSLFKKNITPYANAFEFVPGENSPRYAFGFQSLFKRPRILILVDEVQATYFLSFHYVLGQIYQAESIAFFVIDSAEVERWTQEKSASDFVDQVIEDVQPTVVIFSRYELPYGDVLPGLFKQKNISTVCHVSEKLLNLNEDMDLLYASTAALGDRITTQFPDKAVFYGMYAPYLDFLLTESAPATAKPLTIGYVGSVDDQRDLNAIAPAIQQALTNNPNIRFETFGTVTMPESLESFGDRTHTHQSNTDYAGFLNQLHQLGWAIGLAPLEDTELNRCKAPTKFVEYTSCAIPTIASSGPVYEQFTPQEQILTAGSEEWTDKIQQLIDDPALRETLVKNGQTHCAQTFSLGVLETQIKELLAMV